MDLWLLTFAVGGGHPPNRRIENIPRRVRPHPSPRERCLCIHRVNGRACTVGAISLHLTGLGAVDREP